MKRIRVLLADDHSVVRKGLRMQLQLQEQFEVVGEAADGREAVQLAEVEKPDVVIMDIAMPGLGGIEATAQIVKRNPRTGVVIFSMHADDTYLSRALAAGAKGYLLKDGEDLDLARAVEAAADGKSFFSPAIAGLLAEDYMRQLQQRGLQDSYDLLTEREKETLQLLAEGKSNKDVAKILNLSVYTVETHRSNIMEKLDLHTTADIILYAVRKKIISP
ncbi:MAG TPA: response regulator transcription factor [Terriglobales bacterium]|nr:response regulator transcription factor [Terriglobales bacterium]